MSMQSHLAELEKKHQALEAEITDCLAHRFGDRRNRRGKARKRIAAPRHGIRPTLEQGLPLAAVRPYCSPTLSSLSIRERGSS